MADTTILFLLVATGALAVFAWRVAFWVREGRRMQESGHLSPPPSILARLVFRMITPVLRFLTVGPVTTIGRKNLRKAKGRRVLIPNHTFQMDFSVVYAGVGSHFRYMTASSELKGFQGFFGAWTGSIPVNTKVEHGGEKALNASIESLVENPKGRFLIFPQGKLLPQDKVQLEDFRTGAARLLQAVSDETDGEPVWAVPMGLYYVRDKSKMPFSHRLLWWARRVFGVTNYGAVVVIGEPMEAKTLPSDIHEATKVLYERVAALAQEAARLGAA
jgi:hypothetical protein